MGPPPTVTGISPKEASAGMKITIRGENLGVSPEDLLGVLILGCDALMTVEWKSSNKITALCPGASKEGKGDIIIATKSGGLGSCTVQLRVFKESIGPLKEVAVWTQEKYFARRKNRAFSPSGAGGRAEHDDALGLSVEGADLKMPEERLLSMFPGKSSDIGTENFEPAYYLLENHHGTNFEDLQAGLAFLKRKVDGENESQLSFIKANVSSIMDQLDTLKSIRKRFDIDNKEYGRNPTAMVEDAISAAKREADQMFVDVLGRKDRADSTRNALNVLNRFRFLFNLPANIEANLQKNDYDRIIDDYERAKTQYGESDSEIFKIYLDEIEKGVEVLKETLREKLKTSLSSEQQKKLIANLVQLNVSGDPAWECLQVQYGHVLQTLDDCRDEFLQRSQHDAPKLLQMQQQHHQQPFALLTPPGPGRNASAAALFPGAAVETNEQQHLEFIPHSVHFVEAVSLQLGDEFPNLWKLGQAYFKGDLVVEPDAAGKSAVFKEMILGGIRYFANLIRAAVIPSTLKEVEQTEYGSWGDENEKAAGQWLPSCLRHVRRTYASFIELDLPGQALDIIKRLTTDLRIQCLQMIFQTVIDQVHILHEKEEWKEEITDEFGAVTELPDIFENLVSQSVQLIKEALLTAVENHEEDILSYQDANEDLELLIQNVLSSFAYALENAAIQDYNSHSLQSKLPSDSMRLLLCLNNCQYTQTQVLPKIQKAFQDVGQLSLERPIAEACRCYNILHGKLFEAYLELKCDPIVAMVEPSMYVGKFDWARCPKPLDARDYVKEILHNIISVHSEVSRVSALSNPRHSYLHPVLLRVVEAVCEEVNRLFCCISRMNSNGCIQAWVDIHCLQTSLKNFLNTAAKDFLADSAKPLYDLERPGDKDSIRQCISEFNKRMKFHLLALEVAHL